MLSNSSFVVIGGGAAGLAAAHALISLGGIAGSDITIVEKASQLGHEAGTSFHGAGLVGQLRHSAGTMRLLKSSVATLGRLSSVALHAGAHDHHHQHGHGKQHGHVVHRREGESGLAWHQSGSLRYGCDAHECAALEKQAKAAGVEVHVLHKQEAEAKLPLVSLKHDQCALYVPSDGWFSPAGLCRVYEQVLRSAGVHFALDTAVEQIRIHHHSHRVEAVHTSRGTVDCRYVVNAAGAHASHVARLVGLDLPVVPVRHQHFVAVDGEAHSDNAGGLLSSRAPCFRFVQHGLYGRPKDGGVLLGAFDSDASLVDPHSFPLAGSTPLARQRDDAFARSVVAALRPHVAPALVKQFDRLAAAAAAVVGWPTFTPDGKFVVGESAKVPGFITAAGCNGHGAAAAPAIGHALVEAVFDKQPSDYIQSLSPNRFLNNHGVHWPQLVQQVRRHCESYYKSEH